MPNITITEEEFAQLVNGQSVERDGVALLLDDFGYHRMLSILDRAIDRLRSQPGRLVDFPIRQKPFFDGSSVEEDPKLDADGA